MVGSQTNMYQLKIWPQINHKYNNMWLIATSKWRLRMLKSNQGITDQDQGYTKSGLIGLAASILVLTQVHVYLIPQVYSSDDSSVPYGSTSWAYVSDLLSWTCTPTIDKAHLHNQVPSGSYRCVPLSTIVHTRIMVSVLGFLPQTHSLTFDKNYMPWPCAGSVLD
jgi:hypothetical protein